MKNVIFPSIIALLLLIVYSCSKKSTQSSLLVGNWNVANDSSLNTNKFYTLSESDSGTVSSNYIGAQCAATFDVSSKGDIVTSFFNCSFGYPTVDSAKYALAGNQITISILAQNHNCCTLTYFNPAITRTYTISNLTATTATLTFSSVSTSPSGGPAGPESEIINLSK
jgi:hypothetical protein